MIINTCNQHAKDNQHSFDGTHKFDEPVSKITPKS